MIKIKQLSASLGLELESKISHAKFVRIYMATSYLPSLGLDARSASSFVPTDCVLSDKSSFLDGQHENINGLQ